MKCIRCPICGRLQPNNGLANYCCGKKVSEGEPCKVDLRGYDKAAICRTNRCGQYDKDTDTCQIQVRKGKSGAVSYLYAHPNTRCPNDPPMWSVDNGIDAVDAGTHKPQRAGNEMGGKESVG